MMRKIIVLCVAVLLCSVAVAKDRNLHRVLACNIRVALAQDEQAGNGWSERKYICEEVMKRQKGDIYCLQEVISVQHDDIRRMFPTYFVLGYDGPEMDAMPDTEYHGVAKNVVMFSKKRYELLGAETYWLSETPLIGGSQSWGSARARHVSWVRLKDRKSGKVFRVASIHLDHISQDARLGQIDVFIGEAAQYPAEFPQILVGDFNSKPTNEVAKRLTAAGWRDSFVEANDGDIKAASVHGFKGDAYKPKGEPARIDFIYMKGAGLKAVSSHLVKDQIGGKYPSDHYFLSADIEIK